MCGSALRFRLNKRKNSGLRPKTGEAQNRIANWTEGRRPSAHQAAKPQDSAQAVRLLMSNSCLFCKIISRDLAARIVFEDETSIAFLDHRPVFPGHCLVVPKEHCETLTDLPAEQIEPFFKNVQLLARAVETGMEAHGTFVAMNNRVSQSVPHLHVHVVPRKRKDGLRGFFWPRYPYKSDADADLVQSNIRDAVANLVE
jgi:histidine triad (HIT) family protein